MCVGCVAIVAQMRFKSHSQRPFLIQVMTKLDLKFDSPREAAFDKQAAKKRPTIQSITGSAEAVG